MDYQNIYDFWKEHPEYWITIKNKEEVDKTIFEKFYKGNVILQTQLESKKSFIGYIIYLDQLHRHFFRHLGIEREELINDCRKFAVTLLDKNSQMWVTFEDWELVFCLMPYKHLKMYDTVFENILKWCKIKNIFVKDNKLVSDFFNDTYRKAFCLERIKDEIILEHPIDKFSVIEICDYFPLTNYTSVEECENQKKLFTYSKNKAIVSLSGGVDSMVMVYYLRMILKKEVEAIHIIYGNRNVSEQEYSFIATFCKSIGVKLNVYRIKYFQRQEIEREFYEKMTRAIRFNVYKIITNNDCPILLGHIKEDLIENVWTNFARGQHLHNLQKMEFRERQMGVLIERPLLHISKDIIYKCSKIWKIPYLKDTTPEWSNRGKFRNSFYPSVCLQYGKVDDKILEVSNFYKKQLEIVEKLVYKPILESYNNDTIEITKGLEADLDKNGWVYIIENFCVNKLRLKKPSVSSIKNFYKRITEKKDCKEDILCQMRKEYQFVVFSEEEKVFLKIIYNKLDNCGLEL